VYHHQPRYRILLDPYYYTIYLGDYIVWVLPSGLELGRFFLRVDRSIEPRDCHTVGKSAATSFHPITGQLQVLERINVDVLMVH
jgi:hypothetical protein